MDGKVEIMVTALSQTSMSEVQMRAADADRDRTVERLRDAAAEGRLTPDDLLAASEEYMRGRGIDYCTPSNVANLP